MPSYINEDTQVVTEDVLLTIMNLIGAFRNTKSKADGYKNSIYNRKNQTRYNMSSIARASKDLVMSFPLLCTDTIQPSTALMIAKAVERNNVSMLQMLISAYHIRANNGIEAIKMIHTNMDQSFRAEDLIDAAVGVANYTGVFGEMKDMIGTNRPVVNYSMIREDAHRDFLNSINKVYPVSSFSESSVANFIVSNHFGNTQVLKEAIFDDDGMLTDEQKKELERKADEAERNRLNNFKIQMDIQAKGKDDAFKQASHVDDVALKLMAHKRAKDQDEYNKEKDKFDIRRSLFQKQILDSDIKKSNEVQPTLIIVPFYYTNDVGEDKTQEFIAGVKSRLITCSSAEIINQISNFKKSAINLHNLIKATTKEVSFSKEFIGAINQAKIDAKRDSKLTKSNPIWRSLQSRSSRSGIQRLFRSANSRNAAAAITTLVITIQEADYIAENFGVDVTNPVTAREFMEAYNLLCFIIVDEQTEVTKWLYDGEKYFTDYSFSALERDNNSNDTRKLISLLNKTR